MVAPHPRLLAKIKSTGHLIRQNKAHLVPDLVRQFPDFYISVEDYQTLYRIRPWKEKSKPLIPRLTTLKTMQPPPVRDRILVLCVDFPDKPAMISTSTISNRFFSSTGKSLTGFYSENSYGKYIPTGEVHGWYRAPNNYSYYVNSYNGVGTYPHNSQGLAEDVINIASNDPGINWASFDNNNNFKIDYVYIIHSGAEAAYNGNVNDIWAHVWTLNTPFFRNGYTFDYYATTSEFMSFFWDTQRTGIDSHEFGHLLGLPDLYDTSNNSYGAGAFTIMAFGSWTDGGITPTHLDAWCKYKLGFSRTIINQVDASLPQAETSDLNYIYTTLHPKEYFMVENRQAINFDSYIPATGLLVWKVNENMTANDSEFCYLVGLIQADQLKHLEQSINTGDPGDSFPGSLNIRIFSDNALCDYSRPNFVITNISDPGEMMTYTAAVQACQQPQISMVM